MLNLPKIVFSLKEKFWLRFKPDLTNPNDFENCLRNVLNLKNRVFISYSSKYKMFTNLRRTLLLKDPSVSYI